jgi:L-seryl-tRNA(Ser) seleniumtransferase
LAEYGSAHERTVQEALSDGVGLTTFSGDKLLGGPQAGIIAGSAQLIARVKNNPLLRALRVGKMTIAALAATLRCYRDGSFRQHLPIFRMLSASLDDLRTRADRYRSAAPAVAIVESDAFVGGGSLPQQRVASIAVAIETEEPDRLAALLRNALQPIVGRVAGGRYVLDLRTIAPEEDDTVIAALTKTLRSF